MSRPDACATTWTHADAWVLAALDGIGAADPIDLTGLIARADAIEHAVPEARELATAAGRLTAAGLMGAAGERFWLTEAGLELCAERRGRGHWSESLPIGLRKLGPPTGAPFELPDGAFARAVQAYLDRAGA